MLQCVPQMLQCTPRYVVTFHFHFFKGEIKKNIYTVILKQSDIFVQEKCEINMNKNYTLNLGFIQTENVEKC